MTIIYQFSIPDVTCSGCTGPIEKRLKADFNAGYEYNADPARKTLNIIVWEHEAPDQEIGSNVCRFLDEEMGVNCVFLKSYPLNFKTDYPSSPSQHAIPDPPPEARKKTAGKD